MADIVVTTSSDIVDAMDGVISLREAIEMANANVDADTITFDASLDGEEINLQSELVITQGTVTINGDVDGDGNPDVVISGDSNNDGNADSGDTNIMTINAGAAVNLESVHLTEGYARGLDGGYFPGASYTYDGSNASAGITNSGTLTITDSIISDNRAVGGDGYGNTTYAAGGNGGSAAAGILNNAGAVLTINETLFDNNVAYGGSGGTGDDNFANNGYIGGDGGSASSSIANFGLVNSNEILFNDGLAYGGSGGRGGYGYDDGGNGGDGGDATLGILNGNTGTLTGDNTGNYLGTAFGGDGGAGGTAYGSAGNPGSDGQDPLGTGTYTFVNQGGDVSGFTDTGFGPFYGSVSNTIATAGDDTITGDANAAETIIGLAGDDVIDGGYNFDLGANGDTIFGGAGNDNIRAGDGAMIMGGTGNDTINMGFYSTAYGGSGNDTIFNSYGSTAYGGSGNDRLYSAFSGGNLLDGGAGDDFAVFSGNLIDHGFGGANSADLLVTSINGGQTNLGNIENLEFDDGVLAINAGSFGNNAVNTFSGNAENNIFFGLDGNDTIIGAGGNDALIGGDGDDELNGNTGNDLLDGGIGADTLNGGNGIDAASYEDSAEGVVVFTSGRSGRNGEAQGDRLTDIENITGSDFQDQIVLNADTAVDNTVNAGDGDDRIRERDGGTNTLNGQDGDDNIFGGTGNDTLNGGNGEDNLFGGAGNDVLNGGVNTFRDVLFGSSGNDELNGGRGNDALRGNTGEDTLNGGDGTDNLQGGNNNDILNGDEGVDTLDGGSGSDILNGGTGNDRLTGGGSNDIFIFEDGSGIDRITDFNFGSGDQIDLTSFGLADFDAVIALAVQAGDDVRIQLDGDDRLILEDTTLASLDADDFILV